MFSVSNSISINTLAGPIISTVCLLSFALITLSTALSSVSLGTLSFWAFSKAFAKRVLSLGSGPPPWTTAFRTAKQCFEITDALFASFAALVWRMFCHFECPAYLSGWIITRVTVRNLLAFSRTLIWSSDEDARWEETRGSSRTISWLREMALHRSMVQTVKKIIHFPLHSWLISRPFYFFWLSPSKYIAYSHFRPIFR